MIPYIIRSLYILNQLIQMGTDGKLQDILTVKQWQKLQEMYWKSIIMVPIMFSIFINVGSGEPSHVPEYLSR